MRVHVSSGVQSIAIVGLAVSVIGALFTPPAAGKAFVLPHILEKSGTINNTTFTFDTTLFMTYNATLNGSDRDSAHVDLYLYDEATGDLMHGVSNTICGPCSFDLSAQSRKLAVRLDDLILSQGGGFDASVKLGFGIVVVGGSNPEAVNVQGFVVNSHTSPFDLSVFGWDPPPIASARTAPPGTPETRRVFVLPHVLEKSGLTAAISNTFDSILYATYSGGLPGAPTGSGASMDVYLYDQVTGQPMLANGGGTVCNPCTYNLGTGGTSGAPRKRTIVIDDLITAAGGFGSATNREGFVVVSVGGDNPSAVSLQGFVVNSHTSPFDLSAVEQDLLEMRTNTPPATSRAFVLPHVLEKSGLVADETFTEDTTLEATYTGGLGGLPQGQGASLDLYLYDDAGAPMKGSGGATVCNPCTFGLGTGGQGSPSPRKQSIRIDDLITAHGGFDTTVKLGFGIVVVSGADPDRVSLQGFVVNSHWGPFDVSVFGFDPQPIGGAALSVPNLDPPGVPKRVFVLPHVLEKSGTINDATFTFDTTIFATYAGGLPGSISNNGATMKLYLYDSATGSPLTGATGEVCNPCLYEFTASARKQSIVVDDLITSRGGGFGGGLTKSAFGVLVEDGDVQDLKVQGFVVNAHTGPFDLSVFGFDPQPLPAAAMVPMPVQITPGPGGFQISVPTVIGGHYAIQSKDSLADADWDDIKNFDGDGAVQTIKLSGPPASQQYLRVKGM